MEKRELLPEGEIALLRIIESLWLEKTSKISKSNHTCYLWAAKILYKGNKKRWEELEEHTSSIKKNYFCKILSSVFNISETHFDLWRYCYNSVKTLHCKNYKVWGPMHFFWSEPAPCQIFWLLSVRESQQRRLQGPAIHSFKVKTWLVCEHLIGKKLGKLVWDSKISTCLQHHFYKVQQHPGEVSSSILKLCVSIGPAGSLDTESILTSFLCVKIF